MAKSAFRHFHTFFTISVSLSQSSLVLKFLKEEIYFGPYLKSAPDIMYRMSKYIQLTSIWEIAEWGTTNLSGQHTPEGIFVTFGPDITYKLPLLTH